MVKRRDTPSLVTQANRIADSINRVFLAKCLESLALDLISQVIQFYRALCAHSLFFS